MSRLSDALISGAYSRDLNGPILDLQYGGLNGWAPNLTEWVSNQAYTSRPLVCILLEAPRLFTVLPNSEKWIASLKSLFELHARTIEGFNAGLKVDFDEHPVGGAGEVHQEFINVTRERTQPKFTFIEKYGRPIQTLLDYWIRYGMMDDNSKFALASTLPGGAVVTDLLADWYTATCLFFVPDPLHKRIDKAWLTTNMAPMSTGDIVGKRNLTEAQEILTLDIEFTGISQYGMGIKNFAQGILDNINISNSDPYMRPTYVNAVTADVAAANKGYKQRAEEVGSTSVTNMAR